MGSKDKFFSITTAAHGFDDIGFSQTAGVITSVAQYKTGKYSKYAAVTANAAHNLTKGQAINITGTTDYDGPTRVVAIVSTTVFVIKRAFTVTKSGAWDLKVAEGNWDAIMAIGADVTAANITLVLWKPEAAGGNEVSVNLTKDVIYPINGGIKKVTITTAGDVRLFRAASTKPGDGVNKALPTIVGYNPTGAEIGDTIDIIGTNFDPIPDRNAVRFTNGVRANVIAATEEILTIVVPVGTVSGVVANICNGGQNATGPTFVVN